MKISLGIDFNPIRTIICYYDEQNKRVKTLYNQPSLGILPKGEAGLSFYGNMALEQEGVSYNQVFYPTFMGANPQILTSYFRYVLSRSFETLKGMDFQVEYVIFTDSASGYEIKKSVFPALKGMFMCLQKASCLLTSRRELLDLSLILELNTVGRLEKENLLVLDLNNFQYQASMFTYSKGCMVPLRSFDIAPSYTPSEHFYTGSYALAYAMLLHSAELQDAAVRAKIMDKNLDFDIFRLLLSMEARLTAESDFFYRNPDSRLVFPVKIQKTEYSVKISREDYEYALETVLYGKLDSVRSFLKRVKDAAGNAPDYRVLYYGPCAFYTDTKAVIYSVFPSESIIASSLVFEKKPEQVLDLNHPARGAALQSSLRFTGMIPSLSYKNYRGSLIPLLAPKSSLLLSRTSSGTTFYALDTELELPLSQTMEEGLQMPLVLREKEIDLVPYLYEKNSLKSRTVYDRKSQKFIAGVKIGLKEEARKTLVVFEAYSNEIHYDNEFKVEVE